ncbi:surface protein SP1 [Fusarium subglutinans]|uniref:Surface protein SP1 n=1 Tax=Gibberella subglutinans TaxID=42677 RepID=A0A8H5L9H9_GIBSU|nr:surface protein SP1 [Fusarium subglutinans]KAF5587802.1 surface protein SP1 [Fusarium subglutinans]
MNKFIIALAVASTVSAAPLYSSFDDCQAAYKSCVAAGTPEVACGCTLAVCAGEDNGRNREYCASATASLAQPTKTEIPGGCNPAHPGSCPSSYFTKTYTAPAATFTSISGIPGGCNPAHPGSCPSSYFTTTSTAPAATFTSISGIPGGCNPAHPGSCPSSYFTYPIASKTSVVPVPSTTKDCSEGSGSGSGSGSGGTTYPEPKPVKGETWTIKDLIRYCGEGNEGCDYNFKIAADGKTEQCTIIRMPGKDAATESWSNEPCTDGSEYTISWGYVTEPAPAFAVVSVVKGKEIAWFGVSNVNGQKVTTTPSNPFGSGQYGDLGPEQVYTY